MLRRDDLDRLAQLVASGNANTRHQSDPIDQLVSQHGELDSADLWRLENSAQIAASAGTLHRDAPKVIGTIRAGVTDGQRILGFDAETAWQQAIAAAKADLTDRAPSPDKTRP